MYSCSSVFLIQGAWHFVNPPPPGSPPGTKEFGVYQSFSIIVCLSVSHIRPVLCIGQLVHMLLPSDRCRPIKDTRWLSSLP